MIRDERVLYEAFVPREVEYRDNELDSLASALQPIAEGRPAKATIVSGPTGTGKTCVTKFTIERLRRSRADVRFAFINCWEHYSRVGILYRLLEAMGLDHGLHRQSTARDEVTQRLRDYDGPHVIVVLDEVDQLADKTVFYDLHMQANVSMVLIANDVEGVFAGADDRLVSRVRGARNVHFDRYGIGALTAILEARAYWGLEEGSVGHEALTRIADLAAGDARVGISVLRSAAEHCIEEGRARINEEVIETAIPMAREERYEAAVDRLTPDQRVLLEVIEEHGAIAPGELYPIYERRADDPKTDRTMRTYLTKMEHYDLVAGSGDGPTRTYQPRSGLSE